MQKPLAIRRLLNHNNYINKEPAMTLEFNDLEYRVRNTKTGNVIAAFLNSSDAVGYTHGLKNASDFEIETTNAADTRMRFAPELAADHADSDYNNRRF